MRWVSAESSYNNGITIPLYGISPGKLYTWIHEKPAKAEISKSVIIERSTEYESIIIIVIFYVIVVLPRINTQT